MRTKIAAILASLIFSCMFTGCVSFRKSPDVLIETLKTDNGAIVILAYPNRDFRLFSIDKDGNALLEAYQIGDSSQAKSH
jgi:hypothetical protein